MNTMDYQQAFKDLNKDYHEQRDRLLEVEGLLRQVIYLIEIAPDMTDPDSQQAWKSEMQQAGVRSRELLNMREETVEAK